MIQLVTKVLLSEEVWRPALQLVTVQEDIAPVRVPVNVFVVELGKPEVWNVVTTLLDVVVPPTVVPL